MGEPATGTAVGTGRGRDGIGNTAPRRDPEVRHMASTVCGRDVGRGPTEGETERGTEGMKDVVTQHAPKAISPHTRHRGWGTGLRAGACRLRGGGIEAEAPAPAREAEASTREGGGGEGSQGTSGPSSEGADSGGGRAATTGNERRPRQTGDLGSSEQQPGQAQTGGAGALRGFVDELSEAIEELTGYDDACGARLHAAAATYRGYVPRK